MSERQSLPFGDVYRDIQKRKAEGRLHIPVFVLATVMPRSDNLGIFDEGRSFSGVMETEHAKACVTIVASAHVPPTVPTEQFIVAARQVFGDGSTLPDDAKTVDILPPQIIVWWALNSESESNELSDFLEISKMDDQTQREFRELIANQTHKAAIVINVLKGQSIIWGSWGNGNLKERSATGMSRGVPTNKIGHSHVVHIDEAKELLLPENREPTIRDEINFAGPWTSIIQQRFGDEIGEILENGINVKKKVGTPEVKITRQSPENRDDTSRAGQYDGFDVRFKTTAKYEQAIDAMVVIAGILEDMYQNIVLKHTAYYLNSGNAEKQADVSMQLQHDLIEQGFTREKTEELTSFAFGLKPTLIQLKQWKDMGINNIDDLYDRYARVSERMRRTSTDSYFKEIVADTYRPVDEVGEIERTFPVHASAWYLFEDYTVGKDTILVDNFKIFPAVSSTVAGPERILGGVEKRPLAK